MSISFRPGNHEGNEGGSASDVSIDENKSTHIVLVVVYCKG